jgi:hypothetical protein
MDQTNHSTIRSIPAFFSDLIMSGPLEQVLSKFSGALQKIPGNSKITNPTKAVSTGNQFFEFYTPDFVLSLPLCISSVHRQVVLPPVFVPCAAGGLVRWLDRG